MSQAEIIKDDDMGERPGQPRRIFDRQIPWAVVCALTIQFIGGIWWASGQAKTLEQAVMRTDKIEQRQDAVDNKMTGVAIDLAVVKEKVSQSLESNQRIETLLRQRGR